MTHDGTEMYDDFATTHPVPDLVSEAVALAHRFGFPLTVHPATGRLLAALASGIVGTIGETGTGTGAGVAWMLSTAPASTRIISIELDPERAAATRELFAGHRNVTILHGEANELVHHGPFDMLVLDTRCEPGPLHWESLDPSVVLREHGLLVKDDQWPMAGWPPKAYDGTDDGQRIRFFEHPELMTTEVPVAEGYSVVIARRRPTFPA